MGILGKLFGSEKAINSGFELVDKAFYTGEEKAEDSLKAKQAKIALLKAYEAFKVVQRLLALCYCIPYVSAWFITFICSFFMDVKEQFEIITHSDIALANLIILGFYFGGGFAEGVITKAVGLKRK